MDIKERVMKLIPNEIDIHDFCGVYVNIQIRESIQFYPQQISGMASQANFRKREKKREIN